MFYALPAFAFALAGVTLFLALQLHVFGVVVMVAAFALAAMAPLAAGRSYMLRRRP